nr:ATP-binding cassette domain-containing protein [Ruminococcus flavefaciens]
MGPNGAGKTTTMRMLATLLAPDSGDALYNDVSAVKSPEEIRSQLAFLTTDLKTRHEVHTQHHVRLLCRTLPHTKGRCAKAKKSSSLTSSA